MGDLLPVDIPRPAGWIVTGILTKNEASGEENYYYNWSSCNEIVVQSNAFDENCYRRYKQLDNFLYYEGEILTSFSGF